MSSYQIKIIALWIVFLVGTLFHTQLGLMPLFHGQNIAIHGSEASADISGILWGMLAFFTLPMVAIVATAFTSSRRYRIAHLGMTIFYAVMNLLHLIADLLVQPIYWYQIFLMAFLFAMGILLILVSFQWWRERVNSKQWRERVSSERN